MARSSGDGSSMPAEDLLELGDLVRRAVDRLRDGVTTDLRLPAAQVAAVARSTLRVEAQVPDLAGVASRSLQPVAAGDHAGTDADVAGDVDEVVDVHGHSAAVLGEGTEVGVVGQRHRDVEPERREHDAAEGDVVPLQVGGEPDQSVVATDQTRDADPHTDERGGGRCVRDDPPDEPGHGCAHLPRLTGTEDRLAHAVQDVTAQPDPGDDRAVDAEVDGDDDRAPMPLSGPRLRGDRPPAGHLPRVTRARRGPATPAPRRVHRWCCG